MSRPDEPDPPTQAYGVETIAFTGRRADAEEPRLTLPGYEVQRVLGRGGMGIVYLARQVKLNRVVALKMLLGGDTASRDEVARFQAEAEAVARLQHPNIVQIFDVGEHEGRAYFALEYVAGGTLADRLHGTPLPACDAAQLVAVLANAMQYAHERNLLHRDLKPANILLVDALAPKVTDFGLAKQIDAADGRTRTGAVLGTPAYMAPEQAWGQSNRVGPRVDIYALGAILYECLTGRPPFQGATVLETLDQVRSLEPVSPRVLNPGVPRDLETVCLKCLAKEPAGRYLTARELALDLRRFLDGEPVLARPLGRLGRAWRSARKRPAVALAVAATGLALLLGIAVWFYQSAEAARQYEAELRGLAVTALARAEQGERRAEEFATRLDRVLYLQRVQGAVREWQQNGIARARELLDECPAPVRAWEWHYADRVLSAGREITGLFGRIDALAVTPDGKSVVSSGGQDGQRVWDLATGAERFYLEGTQPKSGAGGAVIMIAASPRGLALLGDRGEALAGIGEAAPLAVWSLATGKKLRTLADPHRMPKTRLVASPDARWVASIFAGSNVQGGNPAPVFVVDPRDGKELAVLRENTSEVQALAVSLDGKLLASAGVKGDLCIWDMATFKLREKLAGAAGVVGLAFSPQADSVVAATETGTLQAWSFPALAPRYSISYGHPFRALALRPDGRQVAVGTRTGEVLLFDPETGERRGVYRGHREEVTALTYSPDGTRLVTGARDRTLRVWNPHELAEVQRQALALPQCALLALDPSGQRLFSANSVGGLRSWELPGGAALRQLATGGNQVIALAAARRAPRIAVYAFESPLRVWDWDTGVTVFEYPWKIERVHALTLNPAGTRVFAAGRSAEGVFLRCFDVESRREPFPLPKLDQEAHSLEVSPDGQMLAAITQDGLLRVWTLPEGRELFRAQGATSAQCRLTFSPEGAHLAAAIGSGLRVWRTKDWQEALRGRTAFVPRHLTFSPDGARLACAATAITIWDVTTGLEAITLPHPVNVEALGFSADGGTLIGADTDGSLYLWHASERGERRP